MVTLISYSMGGSFRLIDVPGDGDCFYCSILKSSHMKQYGDVYLVQNILATLYISKVRTVSIGNFMNGFQVNDIQLILCSILRDNAWQMHGTNKICIYFHRFGQPLKQMNDGNHFGYMQQIIHNELNRHICAGLFKQGQKFLTNKIIVQPYRNNPQHYPVSRRQNVLSMRQIAPKRKTI